MKRKEANYVQTLSVCRHQLNQPCSKLISRHVEVEGKVATPLWVRMVRSSKLKQKS